jgi:uncharacterized protein (TIGR02118 family)
MKRLYTGTGISMPDDGSTRQVLDVLHPDRLDALGRRGQKPTTSTLDTLAWTWGGTAPFPAGALAYELEEHEAWLEREAGAPPAAIKSVSFVFRKEGISVEEFRRHYREHVPVAWEHHHGCSRYVQNDVARMIGADTPQADGFSELWYTTIDDFVDRHWGHGEDSVKAVRADTEEFIDFARTFSLIVRPGLS